MYELKFTKQASKDYKKALQSNLKDIFEKILDELEQIVYNVDNENNVVKILSMWSHYETI